MPRKRDFFHTGLDVSRSEIANIIRGNPTGAADYYVDLNVSFTGDGSLNYPFSTIAEGLAASAVSIGLRDNRWWARRNRVFVMADGESETLVLAAEKTDLIGMGYDIGSFPKITGNFTIGTAVNGFRIFNMGFIPTTTAPVVTFPAGMHGWELHDVILYKTGGVASSAGLLTTSGRDFVMNNVRIVPDSAGDMHTIGMQMAGTTAGIGRAVMEDCFIHGVEGIDVVDTTANIEGAHFKRNTIRATNLCIDDNSSAICFTENMLITAAAAGSAAGSGIVDWNENLIAGNMAHASDADGPIPALDAVS